MAQTGSGKKKWWELNTQQDLASELRIRQRKIRIGCFGYIVSALAGIVLSLFLKDPVISVVIPFVITAWKPFATGMWLFHFDTDRRRAWICLAFYIGNAYWLGAALAFVTLWGLLILQNKLGIQQNPVQMIAILHSWFIGVAVTSFFGVVAIIAALRCKVRIWVNPGVRNEADDDFEELANPQRNYAGFNHAIFVVATSLFLPILAGFCLAIASLFRKPPFGFFANVVMPILGFLLIPGAMVLLYKNLSNRIIARHPIECWGQSERR